MASDKNTKAIIRALENGEVDKLSDVQSNMLKQLSFADDQIRLYGPGKKAMSSIKVKYECSESYAYRIIRNTQVVFGTIAIAEKRYFKGLAIEQLIEAINAIRATYESMDDDERKKAKVSHGRDMAMIIKELRLTTGYDKEEVDLPEWEQLKPHLIMVVSDPSILGLEPVENIDEKIEQWSKPKKDFNALDVTDVDFVEDNV